MYASGKLPGGAPAPPVAPTASPSPQTSSKAAAARAMFENRNTTVSPPAGKPPPPSGPSPSRFGGAANAAPAAGGKAPEALVKLFVGAKLARDQATTYAAALAKEGFDTPDKLKLVDESDLLACGITTRFDMRLILSIKDGPVAAAPAAVAPAAAAAESAPAVNRFRMGAAAAAAPAAQAPKPAAPAAAKPKPPPGLSMMEEMKWRQNQANNPDVAPAPVATSPPPGLDKPQPKSLPKVKAKPPPGLSMMEEMKWKQAQAAREANGEPDPPASPTPAPTKTEDKPKPAASSGGLADRQKMLANMLGAKSGGTPPPKDDKPKAAPAKKWGAVGDGAAKPAAATLSPDGPPADLAKYEKMKKMLPQGAVENCMIKDGVDPGYLFEECMTIKSDKKPHMMKPAEAAAAPESAAAPAAAAVEQPAVRRTLVIPPTQPAATPVPAAPVAPQQTYQEQPIVYQQPVYQAPRVQEWQEMWSPEHNCFYYVNSMTGESSWYAPQGFVHGSQAPPPMQQAQQYPMVTVQYDFNPTGMDAQEMQVFKGDSIEVYDVDMNGWLTGKCYRTGMVGLIPQNYTA